MLIFSMSSIIEFSTYRLGQCVTSAIQTIIAVYVKELVGVQIKVPCNYIAQIRVFAPAESVRKAIQWMEMVQN